MGYKEVMKIVRENHAVNIANPEMRIPGHSGNESGVIQGSSMACCIHSCKPT